MMQSNAMTFDENDKYEDTVREDFEEVKEEENEQIESSATVNEEDQL